MQKKSDAHAFGSSIHYETSFMATRIALTHRTDYRYDRSVILNPHTIRLRPAAHTRTTIPQLRPAC